MIRIEILRIEALRDRLAGHRMDTAADNIAMGSALTDAVDELQAYAVDARLRAFALAEARGSSFAAHHPPSLVHADALALFAGSATTHEEQRV